MYTQPETQMHVPHVLTSSLFQTSVSFMPQECLLRGIQTSTGRLKVKTRSARRTRN